MSGIILGPIVGVAGLATRVLLGGGTTTFVAFLVGVSFFWLIYYATAIYVTRQRASRVFIKDGVVLGSRKLSIDNDGVHLTGAVFNQFLSWKAVNAISVQHLVVVLWTEKTSGIFIPRSAFGNKEQEQSFVSLIRSKIDAAPAG